MHFNSFTPIMEMQYVFYLFSVDQVLWCDYSIETSLTVLSHCAFYLKFRFWELERSTLSLLTWLILSM